MNSFVYLLHFDERYPGGVRPQHYLGVARNVHRRVQDHRNGNKGKGGSLTRALAAKGIGFEVVMMIGLLDPNRAFELERLLKRARHHHRLCPRCKGDMVG